MRWNSQNEFFFSLKSKVTDLPVKNRQSLIETGMKKMCVFNKRRDRVEGNDYVRERGQSEGRNNNILGVFESLSLMHYYYGLFTTVHD